MKEMFRRLQDKHKPITLKSGKLYKVELQMGVWYDQCATSIIVMCIKDLETTFSKTEFFRGSAMFFHMVIKEDNVEEAVCENCNNCLLQVNILFGNAEMVYEL